MTHSLNEHELLVCVRPVQLLHMARALYTFFRTHVANVRVLGECVAACVISEADWTEPGVGLRRGEIRLAKRLSRNNKARFAHPRCTPEAPVCARGL